MHTDERTVARGVEHWAVYIVAVGVGAVEDNERYARFCAGLHHIVQRADIGVEAATHILQVEEDDIHILQLLFCGLLVFSVEAYYRQAGLGVDAVVHLGTCFGSTPETMLGTKYLYHLVTLVEKGIYQMRVTNNGGLIGHDGNISKINDLSIAANPFFQKSTHACQQPLGTHGNPSIVGLPKDTTHFGTWLCMA